jgi:hypothetical protein
MRLRPFDRRSGPDEAGAAEFLARAIDGSPVEPDDQTSELIQLARQLRELPRAAPESPRAGPIRARVMQPRHRSSTALRPATAIALALAVGSTGVAVASPWVGDALAPVQGVLTEIVRVLEIQPPAPEHVPMVPPGDERSTPASDHRAAPSTTALPGAADPDGRGEGAGNNPRNAPPEPAGPGRPVATPAPPEQRSDSTPRPAPAQGARPTPRHPTPVDPAPPRTPPADTAPGSPPVTPEQVPRGPGSSP